ncbi:MAG: multidrug effflux MFS transporter [Enhydrobacter sp.]|nr:multidrug effflux MFS transporter [Enhydrobacter sp.]
MALLLCVIPFSQIPLDAYTPALPQMVHDLGTDNGAVQNTVTAYMLGMSLALVPIGLMADALGRKPVLITGLAALITLSIGCAIAPTIDTLLMLRFLQGAAGSVCLVLTYAIAADRFRDRELTAVSGLLGAAWGLAPVLAPAAGGFLVQFSSWRMVFLVIAGLAAAVLTAVSFLLTETLPAERRQKIDAGRTAGIVRDALADRRFLGFTLVFAAMASAQMVLGVVAPFLYQEQLGFSPAAYGAIALLLGSANLAGELGCTSLAMRIAPRPLAFGAFGIFSAGALTLLIGGALLGSNFWTLTLAGALVLMGCGTLCPMMYGMALGLFDRNLGLLGGLISALCYLAVSGAMAIAAVLPETSPAPLGVLYTVLGVITLLLLVVALPRNGIDSSKREAKRS